MTNHKIKVDKPCFMWYTNYRMEKREKMTDQQKFDKEFQIGWNYAGKGLNLPKGYTEYMVEGYNHYLEVVPSTDAS